MGQADMGLLVFLIKHLIKYDIVSGLDMKGARFTIVVRIVSNKRSSLLAACLIKYQNIYVYIE